MIKTARCPNCKGLASTWTDSPRLIVSFLCACRWVFYVTARRYVNGGSNG